jgi:spermidine synthase
MKVFPKRLNDVWFTEKQTPNMNLSLKITGILRNIETPYQSLMVAESLEYGRFLVLDGAIQITERDEFTYHEMMAHLLLCSHPNPQRVLVVGGGDGGIIREIVKHQLPKEIFLVDIDEEVTRASRDFFPSVSSGLEDPRVTVLHQDALVFMKDRENYFDAIVVDSTDPVDFAAGLFQAPFYRDVLQALREDGMMVAQTESPFAEEDLLRDTYKEMSSVFPKVYVAWGAMPTYPTGMWTYMVGSKKEDPRKPLRQVPQETRDYSEKIHELSFELPPFVKALLGLS